MGQVGIKVMETSNTLLIPTSVKVPLASQPARFVLAKVMLLLLPLCEKVSANRTGASAAPMIMAPFFAPVTAVTAPVRGEKAAAETVPAGLPVSVPLIAVGELTLP